jgi:GNAT superfamily N-acetyltransferase
MSREAIGISPLEEKDLDGALELLRDVYTAERHHSPLLPPVLLGDPSRAVPGLRALIARGAVGAWLGGRLVGFMGVAATFPFKGHRAALVGETAHAAASSAEKVAVYEALYTALGEGIRTQGARLHIVAHLAGDEPLRAMLYRLGFGAFLAEELRDLSPVAAPRGVAVRREDDARTAADLDVEHRGYYRNPPIFLAKDTDRSAAERDLREALGAGAALFVHDGDGGSPDAYFVVGPCAGEHEGRLLRGTNSAQVLSAYARPDVRGRGVGAALLDACIAWARERGFERVMVEHETANLAGSAFWGRHFRPYLTFSMRYVEA